MMDDIHHTVLQYYSSTQFRARKIEKGVVLEAVFLARDFTRKHASTSQ
jgi:hypothetical protein